MKNILIPTDFSDNAWDALTYAIRLYDDIPCKFYILNTFEVNSGGVNTAIHSGATKKLYTILKEESQNGLDRIEAHLNEYLLNDKHEYKTISAHGSITSIAKELIIKENINLVVMGTTGASGMKKVLMGSNTITMIKNISQCPIIAVPKDFEFREPELVSFATNLKKLFNSTQLNALTELLLIHNLDLELLHVKKEEKLSAVQNQNIGIIKQQLGSNNISYKEIELNTSIANSLTEYAKNNKVDIICLANYSHTLLERLTHEPVIKKVGFQTQVPLLIISV